MDAMTGDELAYLETCDLVNNEGARKLVGEIRRLRSVLAIVWKRHEISTRYALLREQGARLLDIYETQGRLADAVQAETAALKALYKISEKPVPMCKPDALEDLIPPVSEEERRP